MKSFNAEIINFVIAPSSLGAHWTGTVATHHKDDTIFTEGPMWIIIHMDIMNNKYDDDDDAHMNVFVEYLHHLFEPSSYHTEPKIIEVVVPKQPDSNNCGYCLVRNIGCVLKGGIKLIYKHLYIGIMFSDD